MSRRAYLPVAMALLAASVTAGVSLGQAKAGGLPFITGGGQNVNLNSGSGTALTNYVGFDARATAAGTPGHGAFSTTVYPARGQMQLRTSDDSSHKTVGAAHGEVVCIANYGPSSSANDAGGVPGHDVWEIRFRITHSATPGAEGAYGSLMVQDNGSHNDFADESFAGNLLADPSCGDVTRFQLEPHQGQITVHNG